MSKVACAPLYAALTALSLGACTAPGVMSNTAMDFNETVARASDSQILLNIVRASHRNPTHYSAITQVRDSRNIQGSAGAVGSFPFGPDALRAYSVAPAISASGSLAPSFDVVPLDNREAATGLLHPIDPQIPRTYWQQNWPKMVLLYMFVDDVVINDAAKRACKLGYIRPTRIDNSAHSVEGFKLIGKLFQCLAKAITFERSERTKTYMRETPVAPEAVLRALPELSKADITVTEKKTKNGEVYTVSKTKDDLKFVLHLGGISRVMGSDRSTVARDSRPAVSFNVRSVDGMVYYLGELIRLQRDHGPMTFPGYEDREEVLFNVEENAGADAANNITADFLSKRYSISRNPVEGDRTLTVLALVSQVFSLYRAEKDLPKTSAVEVVGAR